MLLNILENYCLAVFEQIFEKRENEFDKVVSNFKGLFCKNTRETCWEIANISSYHLDASNDPLEETIRYLENNHSFRETNFSKVVKLVKLLNKG